MRKILLSPMSKGQQFVIMGRDGQLEGTPYYNSMKECMIAIFAICKKDKRYTNLYDMPQKQYNEMFT